MHETSSDTASDILKAKAKKALPTVPAEEPFTAADAARKIAEQKFASLSRRDYLRPSSSLDSATPAFPHSSLGLRTTSGLADRVSPYNTTGVSDLANLMSVSPIPPLSSTLRAGKATTGSLLDQIANRSPSMGPVLPGSITRESPYLKNLKDQLKRELRTAVEGRRSALDTLYPKSESDLLALYDIYNNVPDVLLSSHRRNVSDSALFSPIHEDIPPGYYKSHGYDTLTRRPISKGMLLADSLLDPLSSRAGLLHGLSSEYEGKH